MVQESLTPLPCAVVILIALPREYQAVFHYLQKPQEVVDPSGMIYHQGNFPEEQNIELGA